METLGFLMSGFSVAAMPMNLLLAAIGAVVGTMVGVLPGLGPVNAVAMLVPVVFALGLPPESSMILMASIYIGSEYGGRISAILINVPGEASAVMTALEGYPLSRQGMAGVALSLSAWTSFLGSVLATVGIVLAAPVLSKWALAFGPVEYVALMIFAFACLTGLLAGLGDDRHRRQFRGHALYLRHAEPDRRAGLLDPGHWPLCDLGTSDPASEPSRRGNGQDGTNGPQPVQPG